MRPPRLPHTPSACVNNASEFNAGVTLQGILAFTASLEKQKISISIREHGKLIRQLEGKEAI